MEAITRFNLSEDFELNSNNKVELSEELKSRIPSNNVDYYTIHLNSTNVEHKGTTGNEARRRLFLQGNFGYLHLDFTYKGTNKANNRDLFTIPNGVPRANGLMEIQTFDGGTIYLTDNGNVVKGAGLTNGQRYIVDLTGFWRR